MQGKLSINMTNAICSPLWLESIRVEMTEVLGLRDWWILVICFYYCVMWLITCVNYYEHSWCQFWVFKQLNNWCVWFKWIMSRWSSDNCCISLILNKMTFEHPRLISFAKGQGGNDIWMMYRFRKMEKKCMATEN